MSLIYLTNIMVLTHRYDIHVIDLSPPHTHTHLRSQQIQNPKTGVLKSSLFIFFTNTKIALVFQWCIGIRTLHCKPRTYGFESASYLCLWDMFPRGITPSTICLKFDHLRGEITMNTMNYQNYYYYYY